MSRPFVLCGCDPEWTCWHLSPLFSHMVRPCLPESLVLHSQGQCVQIPRRAGEFCCRPADLGQRAQCTRAWSRFPCSPAGVREHLCALRHGSL